MFKLTVPVRSKLSPLKLPVPVMLTPLILPVEVNAPATVTTVAPASCDIKESVSVTDGVAPPVHIAILLSVPVPVNTEVLSIFCQTPAAPFSTNTTQSPTFQ